MVPFRALAALLLSVAVASAQPIIIDTDAGSDDVLAVALLLAHRLPIEAITVVNGMAHVDAGARKMRQLVETAGFQAIPVYEGGSTPLRGSNEFPSEWRTLSDDLPGVMLPAPARPPESLPAADYLVRRLSIKQPQQARILALGPLTNIAEALRSNPEIARSIFEIVIMGGAIRTPGNAPHKSAEWNMYIDPLAAQIVFRSGVPIRLIPLNATNNIPIGPEFLHEIEETAHLPLGQVATQVLQADREMINAGSFYAWDPLAAAALLDARIVTTVPMHIEIGDDGRTFVSQGTPNAKVAVRADSLAFRKLFLESFSKPRASRP